MKRRRLGAEEIADFSVISPRPDASKSRPNTWQNTFPHGFMSPSPYYRLQNHGSPFLGDDIATTTAANKGISPPSNTPLGRGQPFLLLYLLCGIGKKPVSILPTRGADCVMFAHGQRSSRRNWFVRTNGILMVVNIAFLKNQQETLMQRVR